MDALPKNWTTKYVAVPVNHDFLTSSSAVRKGIKKIVLKSIITHSQKKSVIKTSISLQNAAKVKNKIIPIITILNFCVSGYVSALPYVQNRLGKAHKY